MNEGEIKSELHATKHESHQDLPVKYWSYDESDVFFGFLTMSR